jgi:predicted ArsR family transcriptional regulator
LTPRSIVALLSEHERERKLEAAELLSLHAMAARGEPKELEKRIKELSK